MKLEAGSPDAGQYTLVDVLGNTIPFVKSFDTETEIAEVFIGTSGDVPIAMVTNVNGLKSLTNTTAVATVHLPGCKLIKKEV